MILQFIFSMLATLSLAVLFGAPKRELPLCGLTGGIGWLVYLLCLKYNGNTIFANLIATLTLTIISRTFAAIRKNPVTVYLISGILPLVPGAGIYYMSYYFIMNNMAECSHAGMNTVKVAGAIVLGIVFGCALPQSWFNHLGCVGRNRRQRQGR